MQAILTKKVTIEVIQGILEVLVGLKKHTIKYYGFGEMMKIYDTVLIRLQESINDSMQSNHKNIWTVEYKSSRERYGLLFQNYIGLIKL